MAFVTRSKFAVLSTTFRWNDGGSFFLKTRITLPLCTVSSNLEEQTEKQQIKAFKDLPGPISLPVIGTSWIAFLPMCRKPFGKLLLSLQQDSVNKYGKIYRIDLPGMKAVQLANPCDVAKVLRSEPKYPRRFSLPLFDFYLEKRKKIPGLFFANDSDWYKHRSVLSKRMLQPKEVAEYASPFNEIVTDFIERLRKIREPFGSARENEVQGLDNELFKWSFESVAELLFDKRFGCLEPEINKDAQTFIQSIGDFLHNLMRAAFCPIWLIKVYEPRQVKQMFESFDKLYEYAELFINRRLEEIVKLREDMHSSGTVEVRLSFFEFLMSRGKLTKEDLLASVIDVLVAGVDTTSNTMQWILYMIATNPEKQDILRQEVMSVLGDLEHASPNTLANMPYLKACVRETLRLYPVLSVVNRIPAEDIVLSGFHIPAGTQLDFLCHVMGRDETVFIDAEKFQPERWLRNKEDRKFTEAVHAFSSTPFGFGTRMCLGRRIAEMELHLLLARIVQEFEIRYAPGHEIVEPFVRGATIPDRPVRVQFVDRRK